MLIMSISVQQFESGPSVMDHFKYNQLAEAAFTYPAIDNHTHPLLLDSHRNKFPFEGLLSEATGEALTEDSIHTLACYRATKQLSELFACENNWQAVKTELRNG